MEKHPIGKASYSETGEGGVTGSGWAGGKSDETDVGWGLWVILRVFNAGGHRRHSWLLVGLRGEGPGFLLFRLRKNLLSIILLLLAGVMAPPCVSPTPLCELRLLEAQACWIGAHQ